jgi:hypothetical protein
MPFIEYFNKLGRVKYDLLGTGSSKVAINIMARAKFLQISETNAVVYYNYTVKDTDTPEIVAYNYYNDAAMHWVIIYSNDIYNIYTDWVKSSDEFQNYLHKKYGDDLDPITRENWTTEELVAESDGVHHFEDYLGNYIDVTAYATQFTNNPDETKPSYVTYYNYEYDRNEALRNIRLPRKDFISLIDQQMNDLFFKS